MTPKKISLLIALCMMLNNTAVAGVMGTPSLEAAAPVIQTSVFQLTSLIRLPFTMTAKLISEEAPLLPEYKKTAAGKDAGPGSKNEKDSQSTGDNSFFFSNAENTLRSLARTATSFSAATCDLALPGSGPGETGANPFFIWLGFKYLFLLACLMALSKSNLPWEIEYISA